MALAGLRAVPACYVTGGRGREKGEGEGEKEGEKEKERERRVREETEERERERDDTQILTHQTTLTHVSDFVALPWPCHQEVAVELEHLGGSLHLVGPSPSADGRGGRVEAIVIKLGLGHSSRVW